MLVNQILEYRALKAAKDAINAKDKETGYKFLAENPSLLDLMGEMIKAQIPADSLSDREAGQRLAEVWQQEADDEETAN